MLVRDEASGAAPGERLRALLARSDPLVLPGCADALTARLAEAAGFDAIYATGAGFANSAFGLPDLGLTTMTEVVEAVARISSAVALPVVADLDTGFGNALNVRRAVTEIERAGAAAVQIEDQVFPKRCGHFEHKEVVPAAEMVAKVRAALDARRGAGLVVIARTDAIAVEGFEAAVERACAYAEAGADLAFVEAPESLEQLAALPGRIPVPLVANVVEGGLTPPLGAAELGVLGYRVVLFANTALRAAALAVRDVLGELRQSGDSRGFSDRLLPWSERQALVGLPELEALEARYRAD